MAISESQKRAVAKYNSAHYDRVQLMTKSGGKDALKKHASTHDSSLNAFLIRAVRQALEDDGADAETIRAICGDSSGR